MAFSFSYNAKQKQRRVVRLLLFIPNGSNMRVEIISIGDELLVSDVLDTCSAHLSRTLWEMGVSLTCKVTVREELASVWSVLRMALARADLVLAIASPYEDEKETLHTAVTRLRHSRRSARYFSALLLGGPENEPLPDAWQVGQGRLLLALPRDRATLAYLWETAVFPFLQARLSQSGMAQEIASLLLRTAGIAESSIRSQLEGLADVPHTRITYDSFAGQTNVRLWASAPDQAKAQQRLEQLHQRVLQQIGDYVYGREEDKLEQVVLDSLCQHNLQLSLAECHTNQVFARTLALLPGSAAHITILPGENCAQLARYLGIDPPGEELSGWCRAATVRMLQQADSDVSLLLMKNMSPGGVQIMVVLASASGTSITQRSFGGHPESIDYWALSLGMAHLRFWLQARAQLLLPPSTT